MTQPVALPLPSQPRTAFNPVMLKPQPAPASCQDGFPAGASVFRLAGTLHCRLSRLRSLTVKAPMGGARTEKGSST